MIIYILVSNFTYFKRKGFKVAVGVSFMFLRQKLANILIKIPKSLPRGPLGLEELKTSRHVRLPKRVQDSQVLSLLEVSWA